MSININEKLGVGLQTQNIKEILDKKKKRFILLETFLAISKAFQIYHCTSTKKIE